MSLYFMAMCLLKPASRLFTNRRKKSKGLSRQSKRDEATTSNLNSASNSDVEQHDPPPAYELADDTNREKCQCGTDLTVAQEIASLRTELEELKQNLRLLKLNQKAPQQVTPQEPVLELSGEVDILAVSGDTIVTLRSGDYIVAATSGC